MNARDDTHWAQQSERGSPLLMRLTAWAIRHMGRRALAPIVWLIVLYFYLTGRQARTSIAQYQARLRRCRPEVSLPPYAPVYRQFLAFSVALLDKLDVWRGRITLADLTLSDPDKLHQQLYAGTGQILVGSHLGNIEVCRALAERERQIPMNVLIHSKHAEAFNRLLGEAGAEHVRLIQVSELDTPKMMQLSQALARGEWLTIAADRIPLSGERTVEVDFLGDKALLPQGPWLLAGLLGCPVNTLHCTRQNGRYHLEVRRLADQVSWTRSTRADVVAHWAQAYAHRLEDACAQAPLQWFNFYPFWKADEKTRRI